MTNGNSTLTKGGRWGLSITPSRVDGHLSIALGGRLAASEAPRLLAALNDAGRNDGRIVLDLRELDYISSAGILALQSVSERLRERGGGLELRDVRPAVQAVLDVAGWRL